MATLSFTLMANLLKRTYENPEKVFYRERAMLGMINKKTNFSGADIRIPIIFGQGGGVSATFTNAQGDTTAHTDDAFVVTHISNYALAQIDGAAIDMSKDAKSQMEPVMLSVDAKWQGLADSLAHGIYRTKAKSIGIENGTWTTPGTSLVLTDLADVNRWQIGQVVRSAATGTPTTLRTGSVTVSKINRVSGTITFSGAIDSGIAAFAQDDVLYVDGDVNLGMSGIAEWNPATPGTLFGVDQTVGTEVAGAQVAYATSIESTINTMMGISAGLSSSFDHIFMHPSIYAPFVTTLSSKNQYERAQFKAVAADGKAVAGIGYKGIIGYFDGFAAPIVLDPFCPVGKMHGIRLEDATLYTNGKAPRFLDYGRGEQFVTLYNADGIEVRQGYRGNFTYRRPISAVTGTTS